PIQQSPTPPGKDECDLSLMSPQNRPFTSNRILFITAEHPILSGYALPVQAVIIPEKALKLYEKKFGPTYMLSIGEIVFDAEHRRAFFRYDFSWEGGSFTATKIGNKWHVKRLDNWVT